MHMGKRKSVIKWTPTLYDRLSKYYDRLARWLFPIGDVGRERVVTGLEIGSLLDIACGTGTLLEKAHQNGLQCTGIDTSRGMLLEVRKKVPGVNIVQASFYALPFAENQFDYVVETNAVSGVDIDAIDVLHEMGRVCAHGGEIRIGDYGKSDRTGIGYRFMVWIGILIGDYPHDYQGLFRSVGYEAEVEELGWAGVYQFIRVKL
jgi:ubiquinone/menaquinone biosynthesis C-methylase UbiE